MKKHSKPARTSKPLTRAQISAFFKLLAANITPKTELIWHRPLDLVVAVVLSAQATDKAVNRVTSELWKHCHSPENYLALGEQGLCAMIRSIGLYRQKARSIIGICQILKDKHNGRIPDTFSALTAMPGIGRKTANVILNVLYQQPTLPVDTHVFRVANRTGLAVAKTPEAVEKALLPKIPSEYRHGAHHYLILHGRYTCKARTPDCHCCKVFHYCNYSAKDE